MAGHTLQRRILILALIVLAVSVGGVILQQIALDQHAPTVSPPLGKVTATARVSFCINREPNVTATVCASNATQNSTYTCQLNLTDPESGAVIVTSVDFVPTDEPMFNVTLSGLINFTPTNGDVGNHTITVTVEDNSSCSNNQTSVEFPLEVININDPPQMLNRLPDVTLTVNTTLFPFFLVDYFIDPDGDSMNFSSTQPTGIVVTIDGSSLVSFTTQSCDSDGELITFTATDPYDANGTSNIVTITVSCPTSPTGGGSGKNESGGGGGGGGGCAPNWECEEWFDCLPSSLQWQRCFDLAGCEQERYLKRHCDYVGPPPACVENWLCDPWNACQLNESQTRTCSDLGKCGTTILRPPLAQECTYNPTCFDGVLNGDESGVDCGGSCGVCVIVERPSIIERVWWWLLFLLLALLTGGMLGGYYRAEIARVAAALGFLARHRIAKDILLNAAQRKSLFERILAFEKRSRGTDPVERYDALAELTRSYLADALALAIEANPDEVRERIRALGLRVETTRLIEGLLAKLAIIEAEELVDDPLFFQASVEELRTAVCLTSAYEVVEIDRSMVEYPITDKMSFYDEIFARAIGILRAVQYEHLDHAQEEYLALIARYDGLSAQEQEQIYPELRWLFDVTRYAHEAVGGRVINKSRFET